MVKVKREKGGRERKGRKFLFVVLLRGC